MPITPGDMTNIVNNPVIPYSMYTQFTPTLPQFYYNVYSREQRIKDICLAIDKLGQYSDYLSDELNALTAVTPQDFEALKKEIKLQLESLHNELKALVGSQLQWNVQHGKHTSSVDAQRDMFNDVTVHAITVKQLAELEKMTVASLSDSGLNVRGLAVVSKTFINGSAVDAEFQV